MKTNILINIRVLAILVACLTVLGVGNAWGATQTFTFNTTDGHTALGISSPSTGSGTDLSNSTDYTLGVVTMNITHGGTNTRIWNSGGSYNLRVYKNGGSISFSVSSAYYINSVEINTSTNLSATTPTGGSWDEDTWSPAASTYPTSVTFSASGTANITTIVVTYTANCDKKVTVSDGSSSTNGSITSITTSPVATCSSTASDRRVSIVVTPSTGYVAPTALTVGSTTGTVNSSKISRTDNGNGTFTFVYEYNQNDNGTISYNAACVGKQCTVTFDKNSGTDGDNSVTATYGSAMTSITPPTREHYDFAGYYDSETNNDGTGNKYYNFDGTSAANWNKNTTAATTLYAKWTEHGLKNYRTVCCTPIATVSGAISVGSINETGGTATWSWSGATTGISKNILKVYNTSDVLVKTIDNISASTTSQSISGLDPCTSYYVTLTTVETNSTYCEGAEQGKSSNFTTNGWAVHYTGGDATEGALLSNVTKVTGASQACLSEDYVATFTANTGYKLPDNIVVYIAGVEVDVDDAYTWSVSNGTGTLTVETDDLSEEIDVRIIGECVSPVVTVDPEDANYYVDDSPDALSVTATLASGTRTYLWKVSTDGGSNWSNATGTNNTASYSGASLSTASTGTIKFKCIVGNSEGGCEVESDVATITISYPPYFPNGKTIFIQAESTSAWTGDGCVMAWFHTAGGSEEAQETYWLFDATGGDAGKKLFATVVPASGNLPYLDIQRFASNCSTWWNKNGGCSYADASGSNTVRSTGKHDTSSDGDYIRWNGSGVTIDLYGDPSGDEWASSLASFSDQGAGVWTATYSNYAPADAAGESQDFKAKTNYNGWIGNTGSNNNATLDGMHVGSTYNITATLDVTDHSLVMSKEFVKGTVHFDLQSHGLAISDLENVAAGSKISAPSEPSATGYTFGGWYKEPACTNAWTFASDVVNETMTLYAKWTVNVYTITANLTGTSVNTAFPSSFTYTGSTTTDLNRTFSVNTTNYFMPSSVSVTMGGETQTEGSGKDYTYNSSTGAFTFDKIITGNIVITATATAKLQSIAITTQPTTRKYFAGESFSSTGAVVTATMGDGSTKAVTASATWTPSGTLSAGASQTVTATYTEAGIEKTATTTIDVYSVTVNKVNEDGDGVSADGVTATWTLGTKALAASATSASKYVFKQWEVTGASIGSTSSANTTLGSPTANVVVNAVFYKPRVIKWSVNGNDSYATGGPTTTVAYNGTISTVPTNPSGLACAGTFIAWTDAAHNNGQTAKDDDSYYGSALYTDAGDFPNITAATTTFYAVFAEQNIYSGRVEVNTTNSGVSGNGYKSTTFTVSEIEFAYNNWQLSTNIQAKASNSPSLNNNDAFPRRIDKIVVKQTGTARAVTINGKNFLNSTAAEAAGKVYESASITPPSTAATMTFTFPANKSYPFFELNTPGNAVYMDSIVIYYKEIITSNYVTECDANIVSVTYNANSGSTSCTNTTTDKTEDFTVCSSAPTRDYYSFDGWLCSADSKTYAANATIDDAAINGDFTLTAQWTPVPYDITYELDGGTNSGSNPATYNVTTATITLQNPTRDHDRFDGWYDNGSFTGDAVTSIPLGSHGDITLYAKWAERHHIEFFKEGVSVGEIWRADDENMEDAVAGQGTAPGDQTAPTACSSKVFMGWSESEIDDETDDEPADLMKPAAGTVDEDKEFHAVWATEESSLGPVTVFNDAFARVDNGTAYGNKGKLTTSYVFGTGTAGEARLSNSSSGAGSIDIDLSDKTLESTLTITFKLKYWTSGETGSVSLTCMDDGATASFGSSPFAYPTTSDWHDCSSTVTGVNNKVKSINFSGTAGKRVFIKDIVITQTSTIYSYSAYSTSCCATKVTLSQNSPEHGTIAFGKTKVGTCGDKEVSLTITPAAGYQLHSYEVATGSGKVAPTSVSPAISLDNNSSAAQNITLTFEDETNGAYDVTATFTLMTVTSWTWTNHDGGGAIADPLNLYVGQTARFDVAYTPAGVDASKKTYTRNKDNAYINWVGSVYAGYSTISGKASTGENTTEVTFTHADGPTKTVNVKVKPLPLVHFKDNVHGVEFDDVVATLTANALTNEGIDNTPTHDDFDGSTANTCEEQHLHLVGWIDGAWPAYAAYMAGTGDKPSESAIVGATGYFYLPGAEIDLVAKDGHTYYAIWAKVE